MVGRAVAAELRGPRLVAMVACAAIAVVGIAALSRAVGPAGLRGVPSVVAIAIAVLVGLLGGWIAGGVIGFVGAVAYVSLLASDGLAGELWLRGVPVVVVWTALAASAGWLGSSLRREARAARASEAARAARTERLYRAVEQMAVAGEPAEAARVAVREGAQALGAAGAWAGVVDEGAAVLRHIAAVGFPVEATGRYASVPLDAPFVSVDVVRDGVPRWFADREAFGAAYPLAIDAYRGAGFEASAVLPLAVDGVAFGFLSFHFREPRAWDADERELALAFAGTAAQALERSRLYEDARGVAATLQLSLLPGRVPDVAGYEVATRYRPASQAIAVGGDWYEVVDVGDGCLGVAAGDVGGKGIDAAAVMGKLRTAMRAYALEHRGPADVLRLLAAYHAATRPDAFVTVLYAVLDRDAGELVMASAGHLPPVLADADGGRWLAGHVDPPLGAAFAGPYRESRAAIAPGDVVVLFTDGVVERRDARLDDGVARLVDALAGCGDVAAEALADHLLEAVLGAEAVDDRALVVVRVGTPVAVAGVADAAPGAEPHAGV